MSQAPGLHAWIKGDDVQTIFSGFHEFLQMSFDLLQLGRGDPHFKDGLLPADLVAGEVATDAVQATGVTDVVSNEM